MSTPLLWSERRQSFSRYLLRGAILTTVVVVAHVIGEQTVAAVQNARPNVVLIMADDVGYECFGSYGSKQYQTPRLDEMAKAGMRFTHCYSQPLCTPSRVKLMTGISNARNYAAFSILMPGQKTIGHYFQAAGYRTMVGGKWQLYGAENYAPAFRAKGMTPQQAGFDEACLWQVDRLGERYQKPLLNINGENRQFSNQEYGPRIVNDHVLQFMEKNKDQPFFVYYPMILVHSPFVKTPDSKRLIQKKQRNFEDMVAYMDKMVGRVIDKTVELGIEERTLLLFCGDNGTHTSIKSQLQGKLVVGGKGSTKDSGTRVPLIVSWPGVVPPGKTSTDLVDFSDMLPTCLDAAGISTPSKIDGRSFFPQLKGLPGSPREWMYCFYCPRPERTRAKRFVRDQRWKLYGDGRFFDVANDVNEKNDLSAASELTNAGREAKLKLTQALASMPAEGQSLWNYRDEAIPDGKGTKRNGKRKIAKRKRDSGS